MGRNIIYRLPIGHTLRVKLSRQLLRQFLAIDYRSFRMFQGLPSHGQRTKANGNTPARNNPYTKLGVNLNLFSRLLYSIKKKS